MKNTGFIDKTLLLETGKIYDLEIVRIIKIPGSGRFFLGRDANGLKHIIPVDYYHDYGINRGDTIKCRLDRINCLGRFFFEPDHPVYERGKTYSFKLISFTVNYRNGEILDCRALVRDVFGREWSTNDFRIRPPLPADMTSLSCLVYSFKKARLFLQINDKRLSLITHSGLATD
jgi:hypothetical protein